MDKFNRFLEEGEELRLVGLRLSQRYKIFLVYFLIFVVFFILYPMIHFGRQSLFLWFSALLFLLVLLGRRLASGYDCYLLTDRRIIFLEACSRDYYRLKAHLALSEITKIISQGSHSIYLYSSSDRYQLCVKERNIFFNKIKELVNLP